MVEGNLNLCIDVENYFNNLLSYNSLRKNPSQKGGILNIIPMLVSNKENDDMMKPIMELELLVTIFSKKREGTWARWFSIKFFQLTWVIIKKNLLWAADES